MTFEYDIKKSIEENITELGQKIMTSSFTFINQLGTTRKQPTKKEREAQEEMVRQFKLIKSTYIDLRKMNRIPDKGASSFNEELIQKIKEMKGSLNPIVTKIPKNEK